MCIIYYSPPEDSRCRWQA